MHRPLSRAITALCLCAGLVWASDAGAQTVRGTVLDASSSRGVSLAGVYVLDRDRNSILVAMADSLGRYTLTLPASGEYFLAAERFGYRDTESPLLALSADRDYGLDLELRPEPLGLEPLNVTVRNVRAVEWLTREFGIDPRGEFGFRLLQGDRLAEARTKGRNRPIETLRWLYIPVSHGVDCVSINAVPRAVTIGFSGSRNAAFGTPGAAPVGTQSMEQMRAEFERGPDRCGRLYVDDRLLPNEQIESIDMARIAAIVTMLGEVRMYTVGFDWSFRPAR